jgi:hypothetical protein
LGPNFFPKRILKYFLYRAAAAATGQPPSLSLLPACHIPMYGRECDVNDPFQQKRVFDEMDTGLLLCRGRDGGDEVLVAQLQVVHKAPFDTAELCVLSPGARDWELKEVVPIVHNNEGRSSTAPSLQGTVSCAG